MKKHYGWRGWAPETSASWRRFWRSGPQTPRQMGEVAAERVARAEAEAEALLLGPNELSPDPYDEALMETVSDPQWNHRDKERRVRAGQQCRAKARRENENKHRRG